MQVDWFRTSSLKAIAAASALCLLLTALVAAPASAQDAQRQPAQRAEAPSDPVPTDREPEPAAAPEAPEIIAEEAEAEPVASEPADAVEEPADAVEEPADAVAEPADAVGEETSNLSDIAGFEAGPETGDAAQGFVASEGVDQSAAPVDARRAGAFEGVDTDGDGIDNGADLDDDNDGLTDTAEDLLEVNVVAGSHFWVTFPRNYFIVPQIDQNIYVSGPAGTNLTIDDVAAVIPANGMYSHSIMKSVTLGLHSQVTEVTADAPVTIVAESYQRYTAEAWVVLPTPALGTEYTAIGYPTSVGGSSAKFNAEINVVASEDNTSVNIDGLLVTLNAGEGYLFDAGNRDLSGAPVTADKPIAVLASRRCLNTGQGACDIVGEQLFPDPDLATEYYVPALAQPHATRVVASRDNTIVTVNSVVVATLNKGQHYQHSGSGLHIETSEPTAAYMIALGGELPGDPVFVLLPGVENALLKSTFAAPQPLYDNYMVMMVATADAGSVLLDGQGVPNAWLAFADNPDMSYQVIPVSSGVHTVTADSSFVPIIYGETNYGSYGFVAGFGQARLGTTELVGIDGEAPIPPDADGDGIRNSRDLDSDGDGISDLIESGQDPATDTDRNGVLDDMEGQSPLDADSDGLSDTAEGANGSDTGYPAADLDGDGVTNQVDLDTDNDGIPDVVENQSTPDYKAPARTDADQDGVDDTIDSIVGHGGSFAEPFNTDGLEDGADYTDRDSDEDAFADERESGLSMSGADEDLDGIDDAIGANYTDPDGPINNPGADLKNDDGTDTSEVSYRERPVVDVTREVMFLVDGSLSIDETDWAIQLGGIAAAMQDPSAFPVDGSVAVGVVQWSDGPEIEVPYTTLDSAAVLNSVVEEIKSIRQNLGGTSPEVGIRSGDLILRQRGNRAAEQVLCMSTDGRPVNTPKVAEAAKTAKEAGVDSFAVLAIDDPSRNFDNEAANYHYGSAVFGSGSVVQARSSIEFASLIVSGCVSGAVSVVGLEVNQSVQDWTGSVPLVAAKPTVVRAFVQSLDSEPDRVVARLHGTRNGVELESSPLNPLNQGGSALAYQDAQLRRGDLNASVNFELPDSWAEGNVTLRLEVVGSDALCREIIAPAATCSADVTFNTVQAPQVDFLRMQYDDNGEWVSPSYDDVAEQARRLESALPIGEFDYAQRWVYTGFEGAPDLAVINEKLLSARTIDATGRIYLGVLSGDPVKELTADTNAGAASWYLGGTAAEDATGFARNQGVQEFARAAGEALATDGSGLAICSDPEFRTEGAPEYPFYNEVDGQSVATLGPIDSANTEIWGIDARYIRKDASLAVVDPAETFSIMSSCEPTSFGDQGRWMDAFYYERLMQNLNSVDWSVGPVQRSNSSYSFLRGSIDMTGAEPTVAFDQTLEVAPGSVPESQPNGDFNLSLLNDDGAIVRSIQFSPTALNADTSGAKGVFTIPVEDAPEFASAVVSQAGNEIGRLQASANAPVVTITSPIAGEEVTTGDLTISWTGEDADGDALTYLVQYSTDGGESYQTIAIDFDGTELVVPRDALIGSPQVRIRVTASDGVLSGSDESAAFTVANAAPELTITAPGANERFDGVQSVFLEADAFDAEDGQLDSNDIRWSSSIDGQLGTGGQVVVNAADLSVGVHTMTAMTTDSGGRSGIDSVTVEIQRIAAPPEAPDLCQGLEITVDIGAGETPTDGDDVILGTQNADRIIAGAGDDVICGLGGDDVIWGQAGNDVIFGDEGSDKIRGGDGEDSLYGGAGVDDLSGGRDNDEVYGEDGDDFAVRGGTGDDIVDGGAGNDILVAGNGGTDIVNGGTGDDKVTGGPRPDTLSGGDGDDMVKGNKGADTMSGGAGHDELFGGPQADTIDGGEGSDMCNGGTTGDGAIEADTAVGCEDAINIV